MSQKLVVCPECDALYRRRPLDIGESARCTRCHAILYRRLRRRPEHVLALVVAALVTFVIANTFPIVELNVQGIHNQATLVGSVAALLNEGRPLVAVLVGATTMMFPLLELLALCALLVLAELRRPTPLFGALWHFVHVLRPWGMIEVFMLGVVVALIKLTHLAQVVPGVALWAFGVLTLLLGSIVSYDLRCLWDCFDEGAPE